MFSKISIFLQANESGAPMNLFFSLFTKNPIRIADDESLLAGAYMANRKRNDGGGKPPKKGGGMGCVILLFLAMIAALAYAIFYQ